MKYFVSNQPEKPLFLFSVHIVRIKDADRFPNGWASVRIFIGGNQCLSWQINNAHSNQLTMPILTSQQCPS